MFRKIINKYRNFRYKEKEFFSASISDIFTNFTSGVYKNSYSYADFLQITANTYNRNSTLNLCINKYIDLVTELPIKFEMEVGGKVTEIIPIEDVTRLFKNANEFPSYKNTMKKLLIDYFLVGECFIYKSYLNDASTIDNEVQSLKVKSYFRVQPNLIQDVISRNGMVLKYNVYKLFNDFNNSSFINYYSPSDIGNKKNINEFKTASVNGVQTNNIIHFLNHNPIKNNRGLSKIILLLDDIGILQEGKEWNRSLLENRLVPSGVFQFPKGSLGAHKSSRRVSTSTGAIEDLESKIKYKQSGYKNAGKSLILDGGLEFKPISQTARDLEYLSGQKFSKDEIARFVQIPLQLVNLEGSSGSYNNYKESRKIFLEENGINFYNKFLEFLNNQLIRPHFKEYKNLKISVDKSKIDIFNEEIYSKIGLLNNVDFLTSNEKRNLCGFEKVNDLNSDKLLVQSSQTLLEDIDASNDKDFEEILEEDDEKTNEENES